MFHVKQYIFKVDILVNKVKADYPKRDVINQFVQFGGAIGGLFLWLTMALPAMPIKANSFSAVDALNTALLSGLSLILYIAFGFLLGLLPSLFTGWVLAQMNINYSYKGLFISLVVGSVIGFAFLSVIELPLIIQILTGGISALILGWSILPRH
ncbi:hypothetical protein [Psychrobacter sp. M13]|uniref:hypothetical protein n=1 Tax=Psychrobacter sp. M13 TaxID=3067275 RepID=UPI00273C6588|nr:hypothetical protein [Psychrobacter sp. M13]WLP94526.1 hypothetical protein Q9G97_13315 [Psychrobacter sp. M13]